MPKQINKAFTLVEMLIVIAIIGILSAGIMGIRTSGSGQTTYTAQRALMTAFAQARNTAVAKQTSARVIIYRGEATDKKLRLIGIIYETDDGWIALNKEIYLPQGVFFVPPETDFAGNVDIPQNASYSASEIFKSTFNNGKTNSQSIIGIGNFPDTKPQTISFGNGEWYSYEFTADGLSNNPGAYVMIATGKLNSKDKLMIENPYDQLGFVIRRTGFMSAFTDYTEMEEVLIK